MSVQTEVGTDVGIDRGLDNRGLDNTDLDAAEADAIMRSYREWAAAGRPGAVSHDEFLAELLSG